jgi:hypothetical protein
MKTFISAIVFALFSSTVFATGAVTTVSNPVDSFIVSQQPAEVVIPPSTTTLPKVPRFICNIQGLACSNIIVSPIDIPITDSTHVPAVVSAECKTMLENNWSVLKQSAVYKTSPVNRAGMEATRFEIGHFVS